jgi:hypothetical protein
MKNFLLLLILLINLSVFGQKITQKVKSISFTQKVLKKRGVQLVLKKVISDSRCPENVNCIWAGECEIEVAVYKNRKLIATENLLLSPKKYKENSEWFQQYFTTQKIKSFSVLPYPKSEVVINPKDYFIKLIFE